MGVGCIQSEALLVSFQDESVTKSGREPDQQEQGAGAKPKPNGRRGEATRQRACLGRVLRKTAWAAGYKARGTFDGPPAKELLGGFRESRKHFLINPEERGPFSQKRHHTPNSAKPLPRTTWPEYTCTEQAQPAGRPGAVRP